ncbi:unnamed protein product [Trichobilharzia szidati]|nr:unnamed protein product [Trichobilharzia szidati]
MTTGIRTICCMILLTIITENIYFSLGRKVLLLSKPDSRPSVQHPVVLIPGIGGNQVYCKPKKFKAEPFPVWLNVFNMAFPSLVNYLVHMKYDPIKKKSVDNDVCKVTIPGWGDTQPLENYNADGYSLGHYFHDLVKTLKEDAYYISNFTVRGAPYDFRRAPNENKVFMRKLKALIEETYTNGLNRSVVLVAHSLGSLYTKYFLDLQTYKWKEKYIRSYISVAAPFGGSVNALISLLSGTNYNIFIHHPILNRPLLRTLTSVSFLLPEPRLWRSNFPMVITSRRNYTVNQFYDLFRDIGFPMGYQMMKSSKENSNMLDDPQGVSEILCVHSSDLLTVKQIVYFHDNFPDHSPIPTFENGDGTVNLASLSVCRNWTNSKHILIPGVLHDEMVSDKRFINLVIKTVGAKINDTSNQ